MDREQQVIARGFGYEIKFLPQLTAQPRLTYYDKKGDAVVLPADPYSMRHYLAKGFTLIPPESNSPDKFVCDVCGKEVSTKLALAGHKRSHKSVD